MTAYSLTLRLCVGHDLVCNKWHALRYQIFWCLYYARGDLNAWSQQLQCSGAARWSGRQQCLGHDKPPEQDWKVKPSAPKLCHAAAWMASKPRQGIESMSPSSHGDGRFRAISSMAAANLWSVALRTTAPRWLLSHPLGSFCMAYQWLE